MQSNDARILRGAAIPTGIAGLVAILASLALAGGKGAFGSAIGTVVVLAFFSVGVFVVNYATRMNQQMILMAGLFGFLIKFIVVFALIAFLKDVTVWNPKAFAWTVLVLTLVWLGAETNATMKFKGPFVEPEGSTKDKSS